MRAAALTGARARRRRHVSSPCSPASIPIRTGACARRWRRRSARLARERAAPRLTPMLDDSDQRVIPAVLGGARRDRAPDAEAMLIARLDADDRRPAGGGQRAGATEGDQGVVRALVQAYERRGQGSDLRGARGDSDARSSSSIGAAARPLLERALADRDWAMRVRAATLLTDAGSGRRPEPRCGRRRRRRSPS